VNDESFRRYLKKSKKSKNAIKQIVELVKDFEAYLSEESISLPEAEIDELESFVTWIEETIGKKANKHLWAISILYAFLENEKMAKHSRLLRRKKIKRIPFQIGKFRGVNQDYVKKLESLGIVNVDQMILKGKTPEMRLQLSEESGVPVESILEFVKLADLTRVGAVKTVRTRLYYDAGIDTIDKMAEYDPAELRSYLSKWIEETGFEGIAPLPKEASNAVSTAKKLPRLVDYE
ncbi:MAG: DUF4332 domain-containing protein, partial [Promethearchaeota archaeon]